MTSSHEKALKTKKIPVKADPNYEGHWYFGKTTKRGKVNLKAGAHDYPRGHTPVNSSGRK